jgi:hypothetical protein
MSTKSIVANMMDLVMHQSIDKILFPLSDFVGDIG